MEKRQILKKGLDKGKILNVYRKIPTFLGKDNKKFQYKIIRQGGTARYYGNSLAWILDSGLGIKVNRLKTFDIPLDSVIMQMAK